MTLLLAVVGAGLLLRLVLALVVFPRQGFASDLGLFASWADTLASRGPGAFYASDASANYPPAYMYVLWAFGSLSGPTGALLGITRDAALVVLLKVPSILADLGVAVLLYRAAGRWFGERAGVIAAALYLFIPMTWYDSALWGQVDAVPTLFMMAALVLLLEGWSELAAVSAVLGVLVKPQAFVCLVVVAPVLLRRHLLAVGSGPVPALGRRLPRLNAICGGLLTKQGPVRLGTTAAAAAAAVAGAVVCLPFDLEHIAPASLAGTPIVGDVAGLAGLFRSVGSQFSEGVRDAGCVRTLTGTRP